VQGADGAAASAEVDAASRRKRHDEKPGLHTHKTRPCKTHSDGEEWQASPTGPAKQMFNNFAASKTSLCSAAEPTFSYVS
jgi:hypothetical protein